MSLAQGMRSRPRFAEWLENTPSCNGSVSGNFVRLVCGANRFTLGGAHPCERLGAQSVDALSAELANEASRWLSGSLHTAEDCVDSTK